MSHAYSFQQRLCDILVTNTEKNYLVKIVFQAWPQVSIPFLFFSFSLTLWSISVVDGYRAKEKKRGENMWWSSPVKTVRILAFWGANECFFFYQENDQKMEVHFSQKNIGGFFSSGIVFFLASFSWQDQGPWISLDSRRPTTGKYLLARQQFGSPLQPLPPTAAKCNVWHCKQEEAPTKGKKSN